MARVAAAVIPPGHGAVDSAGVAASKCFSHYITPKSLSTAKTVFEAPASTSQRAEPVVAHRIAYQDGPAESSVVWAGCSPCSFQRKPNLPVLIAVFEISGVVPDPGLLCASPPLVDHSCVDSPPIWARTTPASATTITAAAMLYR